ncbi:pre-mRNA-splicing factor cwc24-like [Iris pallida]|uniref:Pre-mRNA-splicing factor cwc24-like n=1 Tax=Iris pallida TaxID=29817 RepID=A0AAX6H6T0_IRIPA|nr:pre-mRNA-splicing factor cwc24-like [Iris pallida]
MSRISSMKPLQSGQFPLLTQSSLEQRRQKVWPQGMKAAPLCLTMHTQHVYSPPSSSSFSSAPISASSSSSSSSPNCPSSAMSDIWTGASSSPPSGGFWFGSYSETMLSRPLPAAEADPGGWSVSEKALPALRRRILSLKDFQLMVPVASSLMDPDPDPCICCSSRMMSMRVRVDPDPSSLVAVGRRPWRVSESSTGRLKRILGRSRAASDKVRLRLRLRPAIFFKVFWIFCCCCWRRSPSKSLEMAEEMGGGMEILFAI